jgi:hypothetical protein
MKHRLAFASLAVTALLGVSACGSDGDATSDEVSELCTDIASLQTEVDQIAGTSFDPATNDGERCASTTRHVADRHPGGDL